MIYLEQESAGSVGVDIHRPLETGVLALAHLPGLRGVVGGGYVDGVVIDVDAEVLAVSGGVAGGVGECEDEIEAALDAVEAKVGVVDAFGGDAVAIYVC